MLGVLGWVGTRSSSSFEGGRPRARLSRALRDLLELERARGTAGSIMAPPIPEVRKEQDDWRREKRKRKRRKRWMEWNRGSACGRRLAESPPVPAPVVQPPKPIAASNPTPPKSMGISGDIGVASQNRPGSQGPERVESASCEERNGKRRKEGYLARSPRHPVERRDGEERDWEVFKPNCEILVQPVLVESKEEQSPLQEAM
ncbi:hypothetical protein K435DRAFT_897722 [Dendrothele bispora CBS 962.96]|uniref:Uncharacterized protein n=1 Tax=Dendrothele bispora (strain CBS 962.96) TaxID=1314807 RepID=A0A4S8LZQ9_DENBC|nr:hypothetical protein K435DRAFT_897722 [Dendrothele bispora CBS 962.96]